MRERTKLLLLAGAFASAYFLPIESPRVQAACLEGLFLLKDYARQHVLLCLVPAFFIAGAIGQFVGQGAVLRYLGASAPRPLAYGVASVSGSILAVCSCTVLPLFASIYRRGAGLGPATAFLYSGPAINVLAMILTARVLGLELGLARAAGALGFAFVVGLLMATIFRREEAERQGKGPDPFAASVDDPVRRPGQDALLLQTLLGSGMGKGPALALLLAGPALSLPSMIVIRSYLGTRKTMAYVGIVVALATLTGWAYGWVLA